MELPLPVDVGELELPWPELEREELVDVEDPLEEVAAPLPLAEELPPVELAIPLFEQAASASARVERPHNAGFKSGVASEPRSLRTVADMDALSFRPTSGKGWARSPGSSFRTSPRRRDFR